MKLEAVEILCFAKGAYNLGDSALFIFINVSSSVVAFA